MSGYVVMAGKLLTTFPSVPISNLLLSKNVNHLFCIGWASSWYVSSLDGVLIIIAFIFSIIVIVTVRIEMYNNAVDDLCGSAFNIIFCGVWYVYQIPVSHHLLKVMPSVL